MARELGNSPRLNTNTNTNTNMKHNRHPEDGLVIVLRKAGVKLGTANYDKLTLEDALFFFAACIEPLGDTEGTKNSVNFEFYSNERGDHGHVFGVYARKAELDYIYSGYTFDFMDIYPASWANKYPAHLRAVPAGRVGAILSGTK